MHQLLIEYFYYIFVISILLNSVMLLDITMCHKQQDHYVQKHVQAKYPQHFKKKRGKLEEKKNLKIEIFYRFEATYFGRLR